MQMVVMIVVDPPWCVKPQQPTMQMVVMIVASLFVWITMLTAPTYLSSPLDVFAVDT